MAYTLLDTAYAVYYPEAKFAAPLGGKKSKKGIRFGEALQYGSLVGGKLGALASGLGYGAYRGAKALGRKIRRSKKRKYK